MILPTDLIGHAAAAAEDGHDAQPAQHGSSRWKTDLRISMELDSTEMIKRFVLAGLGAGFMAGAHCREEVAAGTLAAISSGTRSHGPANWINL